MSWYTFQDVETQKTFRMISSIFETVGSRLDDLYLGSAAGSEASSGAGGYTSSSCPSWAIQLPKTIKAVPDIVEKISVSCWSMGTAGRPESLQIEWLRLLCLCSVEDVGQLVARPGMRRLEAHRVQTQEIVT